MKTGARILLSGAAGFVAQHLLTHLQDFPVELWGFDARPMESKLFQGKMQYVKADLADPNLLTQILDEDNINLVFHLASINGGADIEAMFQTNITGTANLLEAASRAQVSPRLVLLGSSAEFGAPESSAEILDESSPLRPLTLYGVSKVAALHTARLYRQTKGLDIVYLRPFNVIGAGQNEAFLVPALARKIVAIERGETKPELRVQDWDSRRDFIDVMDLARGIALSGFQEKSGREYNICSGRAVSVGEVAERLASFSTVKFEIVRENSKQVPLIPFQRGSYAQLEADLGWRPEISLEDSLRAALVFARTRIS